MILIGYSGHAYVICSILRAAGITTTGYCDNELKKKNPFDLIYYGTENSAEGIAAISSTPFFIAIGNNDIRKKVYHALASKDLFPKNVIHPSAIICPTSTIHTNAVMVSAGVIINPLSVIGAGVICNTGCIIEHECLIDDFAHIGPGAVLCGNVKVGENSFIGAKSVVREGITIGKNVIVGAGSVVVKDIPDNVKVVGNPARILIKD